MVKLLFDENFEMNIASNIMEKQYPKAVKIVSEGSLISEDQIVFSYPFYRLVFCTWGCAEFIIIKDNKAVELELAQGNAMIIKPGAFIKSLNNKPYETCGILLRHQSMDYFTNDHLCRHRHRFMLPIRYVQKELSILFQQAVAFSSSHDLRRQYARLIWTHIDAIIKKQNQAKGSHITFIKAKSYVNKHFQLGINRKIVAEELGFNHDYLNALFHQFSGLSFTQYLLKIKLEKATELLHDKDLSISQIAKLSGFNSNTYFGREFKKHYDMTPLNYRKSLIRL